MNRQYSLSCPECGGEVHAAQAGAACAAVAGTSIVQVSLCRDCTRHHDETGRLLAGAVALLLAGVCLLVLAGWPGW
jgi:hypothetical protein